jgi:hypothetical protein
MKTAGVAAEKGEMSLFKSLVHDNMSNDGKELIKEQLMSNGSFFKSLALSAKVFTKDVSESSFVVGDSKRWGYSSMSSLKMVVNRIKDGDDTLLRQLENRHLTIIDHLLENEDAREMLKVYTNSEIKKERDNNPMLHKKIGEVDSYLDDYAKMFNHADDFYEKSIKRQSRAGSTKNKARLPFMNYLPVSFAAEKSSKYSIYGLPVPGMGINGYSDVYNKETKQLGPKFKEILDGYLKGEISEAVKASEEIAEYMNKPQDEKRAYSMEHLIPGYHYKLVKDENGNVKHDIEKNDVDNNLTEEDFEGGTYYRLGVFSTATNAFINKHRSLFFDDSHDFPMVNGNVTTKTSFNKLMKLVYQDVNKTVQKNYDHLKDITLVRRKDPDKEDTMINIKLFDIGSNVSIDSDTDSKIYKYVAASFMTNYEFSNIFNGHIGYYKQGDVANPDLTDFTKRGAAPAVDGTHMRHRNRRQKAIDKLKEGGKLSKNQKESFEKYWLSYENADGSLNDESIRNVVEDGDDNSVVAVVNNINIDRSTHADVIEKGTGNKLSYEFELADAQGITTPRHFKEILSRSYGWNAYDTEVFDRLMDRNHKVTDDDIRWLKTSKKAGTPLKMVFFKMNENGEPVYLKYSLLGLFPAMTGGTEMQYVLDQMEKQGVDQLVFKSGSKASNNAPTTIHNLNEDGSFGGMKSDMKLNPFLIDSSHLKTQTEMPTKLDKETKLGIQSIKNILTNIDMNSKDRVYRYNGTKLDSQDTKGDPLTGKEIYDELQKSAVGLLQTGLNKSLKSLGHKSFDKNIDKESDEYRDKPAFDIKKVKKLLIGELSLETERDLINLLRTDLPLETVPNFAQRAFPKVSAYLMKTGGKIYTNGGSVVQVANMGFDRLTSEEADGVFFLSEQRELTPPIPITNDDGNVLYYDKNGESSTEEKEGSHMRIQKAKIILPFASIFEATGLSYNEFIELYKKGDETVNRKIFQNVMGYRIPNQSMASNDSFEVVGILPPIAGDQGIVYHEITAKTGSDFDIDKMYLATSNFEIEFDKSEFEKAERYIKDLELSEDDMLTILDQEDYYSEYEDYKSYEEVKEVFIRGVLFNKDSPEGREFAEEYGDKKVKSITYSTKGDKGKQNQFVELMNSVIESSASYNDLMSPLDNPIVKTTINTQKYLKSISREQRKDFYKLTEGEQEAKVEVYTSENKDTALDQIFPVGLTNSRVDMLEAKGLISIMANNMTDLSESQKVGFDLKYDLGIRNKDGQQSTYMDRIFMSDKEGDNTQKLSKIVSYLMNASVDAAKDNYIIEGNFTGYTANSAMMLTRLGLKLDDLFTITMNNEILEFSKQKAYQRAKLSDFTFDVSTKELDAWSVNLIRKMSGTKEGLFGVVSRDDFMDNTPDKKEDILGFWNLIQTMGKEFNNAVVAMKSDSNGAGKNISEFMSLKNRLERLKYDATDHSEEKWFTNGRGENEYNFRFNTDIANNPNAKMLGAMANNTLFLMDDISEQLFIETSKNVKPVVNNILSGLGRPLDTDADTISLVYNYLYPNLLYQTGHEIYDIDIKKEEYLLKEFPSKLQRYKDETKGTNDFLSHLKISTNKTRNLIEFPNYKNFATDDKEGFKSDMVGMMNEFKSLPDDHYNKEILDDLVKYAFLTTGMKTTYYSFNNLIPATYFINVNHGSAIQNMIDSIEQIDYTRAMTLMAQTHHNNYKIVKNIPGQMAVIPGKAVTEKEILDRLEVSDNQFSPFIKNRKKLLALNGKIDGQPVYKEINMIDNKDFNTYSFTDVNDVLNIDNAPYESKTSTLFTESMIDDNIDNPDNC